MPTSTINVTQPHALGVEEAVARLSKGDGKVSLMALLEPLFASVKLTKVTAECDVSTLAGHVPLTVTIDAKSVTAESGPVSGLFDALVTKAIAAKLSEALT